MIYIFFLSILFLCPEFSFANAPVRWQLGFQDAATDVMQAMDSFHNIILLLMIGIVVFVSMLLVYVVLKFNKKRNPVPSSCSSNIWLEVVWTLIPLGIVLALAPHSLYLANVQQVIPKADMTIKVTGYQWYWGYQYVDHGNLYFDSNIKYDTKQDEYRLLEVDNRLVVPVNTTVRIEITSADVIHSWTVPAFGVKKDAIPGMLSETWFTAKKLGVFYGQCSELCGMKHGFMPIVVEVVTQEEFEEWIKKASEQFS